MDAVARYRLDGYCETSSTERTTSCPRFLYAYIRALQSTLETLFGLFSAIFVERNYTIRATPSSLPQNEPKWTLLIPSKTTTFARKFKKIVIRIFLYEKHLLPFLTLWDMPYIGIGVHHAMFLMPRLMRQEQLPWRDTRHARWDLPTVSGCQWDLRAVAAETERPHAMCHGAGNPRDYPTQPTISLRLQPRRYGLCGIGGMQQDQASRWYRSCPHWAIYPRPARQRTRTHICRGRCIVREGKNLPHLFGEGRQTTDWYWVRAESRH